MKKKFIPFIATIACGAACACALAACGDDPGDEKGVDVTASVSVSYLGRNEIASVYVSGLSFPEDWPQVDYDRETDGVCVCTASFKSTKKKDAVLDISCSWGYDMSTAQITEKNGQPFTTRVDENRSTMYITIPFGTTISYEFEVGEPSARIENVKFGAPEEGVLTQSQNTVLKHIVEHAMIYVEDGTGAKNFAPFSVYDGDEQKNVFNLEGKHVVADMSEGFFAVYAYFDANDHERIIYDSYNKIIGLKKYNGNIATADSVKYMKVPGTEIYAYRYLFHISDLNDNQHGQIAAKDCSIVLNTEVIGDQFIKSTINTSISTRPHEGIGESHYDFELVEYKVNNGDWTAADGGYVDKEYDKAYTLKYKFTEYEAILFGEKDEEKTEKLLAATDFSAIKLSVNGKTLTSNQCVYEKVGDEHFYTVTIGRDDIPSDYGPTDQQYRGKYFKVGLALESLKTIDTVRLVTLTTASNVDGSLAWGDLFSRYETDDGKGRVVKEILDDDRDLDVFGDLSSTKHIKQCKIKVTVDGQTYTSRLYKFGEDYNLDKESEDIYSAFGDAKLLADGGGVYTYEYALGNEGAAKYVRFHHSSSGLGYGIYDSNPSSNDINIKVELIDVEYMPVTVKKGETKDSRVEFEYLKISDREVTEQGIEIMTTGSNYSADYDLLMKIVATETVSENSIFGFTIEYYSNGVKVAEEGLSMHSTVDGWQTDGSGQPIHAGSGGGSGAAGKYTESRFDFACQSPVMHFYLVDEDGAARGSVFVLIDEIVISPTLSEPMSAE